MEDQYQHTKVGQSVLESDINLIAQVAALADDRVFAELFRMQPFDGSTVRRGIMPYAHAASGQTSLVAVNGATGSVLVNPFRAVIGSRTAVATDAKKNWRDIRSAIAVGSGALTQVVSFGANVSGNPRWDLVYAAVSVDGSGASVSRKVKDPATQAITGQSVVLTLVSSVTLGVQPGTAAASPNWPSAPSDTVNTYYVPLAYVQIPNGFGATSTVTTAQIAEVFSRVTLSRSTGASSLEVADQHYQVGALVTTAQIQAWGANAITGFPPHWFTPSLGGGQSLFFGINFAFAPANNSVIDSRDWRRRFARWGIAIGASGGTFPQNHITLGVSPNGTNRVPISTGSTAAIGFGQTIASGAPGGGTVPDRAVLEVHAADFASGAMGSASTVGVYCDAADSGKLKLFYGGSPSCLVFGWIDFTGPFDGGF